MRVGYRQKACIDCGKDYRANHHTHLRCQGCRTTGPTQRMRERAHSLVAGAVRRGELPNLKACDVQCVDCGERAVCYEHRDYGRPLAVDPVCKRCDKRRGPGYTPGMAHPEAVRHAA